MLSVPEFRVLLILAADRYATVDEIAAGLNVNVYTARAMLDSLRRDGFVEGVRSGCPTNTADEREGQTHDAA